METTKISQYYDRYIDEQVKSGVNDRIYRLFKKLLSLGLQSSSTVLEFGCGIGAMTFLLSKYVRRGKIEAVDISPKSIEFSKQKIKSPNVFFFADDIVTFKTSLKNIDFITLFDVIEHIPLDKYSELFQNLSFLSNENTKICINIPNPAYIEYDIKNHSESLQIIDQPVPLTLIIDHLENNDLALQYFETYSVWVENDYQLFLITKKKEFKEIFLSSKRNFFQKVLKKLERSYLRIKYNYQ